MKKLKVLDLFSGIGGFSLGLERTGGFETVAFCEIDPTCRKVLEKHWPEVPMVEDVEGFYKLGDSLVNIFNLEKICDSDIDVICGGFPCQDISVAGHGKGLEGARSGLWFEYKRLINEIKPKYAIIENVANLRTKGLVTVLQDLGEIGYDSEWHIISASGVGAVHRRERIWIIAYPRSIGQGRVLKSNELEGKKETLRLGSNGEEGSLTDSVGEGLERDGGHGETSEVRGETSTRSRYMQEVTGGKFIPYADDLRFGIALASEEEKQKWRAETASRFCDVFGQVLSIEPTIRRGDDGFSRGVDRHRRERIKQLGNSVVPQIPQLIGEAILKFEKIVP